MIDPTMPTLPADIEDRTWTDAQGRTHAWSRMTLGDLQTAAAEVRAAAQRNVDRCESALRRVNSEAATQACQDLLDLATEQQAEAEAIAAAMLAEVQKARVD